MGVEMIVGRENGIAGSGAVVLVVGRERESSRVTLYTFGN
jgi:hypothetical protein